MEISKTESNEFRILDLEKGVSSLTIFHKRKNKHLYYLDDSPEEFFILSNKNNQRNFALYKAPLSNKGEKNWKCIVGHNQNELLEDFQIFKNKIVLETRKNGLPQLAIIDRNNNRKTYIKFQDSSYAANLASNPNYNSNSFKYVYSSLTTPSTIFSQSFLSDYKRKIWQQKFLSLIHI